MINIRLIERPQELALDTQESEGALTAATYLRRHARVIIWVSALVGLCLLLGSAAYMTLGIFFGKIDVAQPGYTVLSKFDGYEVRQLVPYCIAEVNGTGSSMDEFAHRGFMTLAKYIGVFGQPDNKKREPMDMTAPVFTSGIPERMEMTAPVLSSSSAGKFAMAFVLPLKYTMETAPVPNDSRIQLKQVPARTVAVHVFSGNPPDDVVNEKAQWLMEQVRKDGYKLASRPLDTTGLGWELARYNPPFTIPWLKTNEIQVQLEQSE